MSSSGRPEALDAGPLQEYHALGSAERFLQPQLPLGIFHPNPWCMVSTPTGLGPTLRKDRNTSSRETMVKQCQPWSSMVFLTRF